MIGHFSTLSTGILPFLTKNPSILVEKLNTLHSQKMCGVQKSPSHMCALARMSISPTSSQIVTTPKEMRWSRTKLSTSLSAISFAARLATSCFIDRYALGGFAQPQGGGHCCLFGPRLTSLLHKNRSLSSSSVHRSTCPGLPNCVCFDQVWFFVLCSFLWSFLCHKPQYHDLSKGHITLLQRSAVARLGMNAPCALYHEIGASSAACTT